ncbi:MAG: hypothetical protein IK043_03710 [Candidatus Methanomethylophilaceae archaeon]|nr:hypothetical protein [Candidatus Methanomethylophilaceae archaeon]
MPEQMIYQVEDRPPLAKNIVFAMQQILAIIAATILVPVLVNSSSGTGYLSQSTALIGAGAGTLVYLLLTKMKSPVFLGSSFAFIPALIGAVAFGYLGIIVGAIMAGLVYVVFSIMIKLWGTGWVDKYLPPIIIGPTVALIGFSLAGSAISNMVYFGGDQNMWTITIGVATFLCVAFASTRGSKSLRLYPFIIGIIFGYLITCIVTGFGNVLDVPSMKIMDFSPLDKISDFDNWKPDIVFLGAIDEGTGLMRTGGSIASLFTLFVPIAFVVFAEHIADHKNLGSIIGRDLIKDPGLDRTLLGDGIGSMVGAAFGGCPNTTYGESIGCVALSRNASTWTILFAAVICIIIAFIYPFVAILETIPSCVVGGISVALYGYISVSGLRMFKDVDLNDAKNLYVVAAIFIVGLGLALGTAAGGLQFDDILISEIACALIVGIITNLLINRAGPYVIEKVFERAKPGSTDFGSGGSEDVTNTAPDEKP